jgi:hypothetical protein
VILGEVQRFASPEEALEHFGVKGMHWGVRKVESVSTDQLLTKQSSQAEIRRARAKKVAIGAGVLVAVAGAGFVAYKLHQNGKLSLSSVNVANNVRKSATKKAVSNIVHQQTDIIHFARGREKGLTFLKKGGTPNYFGEWEKALGRYASSSTKEIFDKLPDGKIAARFPDPAKRFDFAGRPLNHEVIIPKSMTHDIHSTQDIIDKIWPKLKPVHDVYYTQKRI